MDIVRGFVTRPFFPLFYIIASESIWDLILVQVRNTSRTLATSHSVFYCTGEINSCTSRIINFLIHMLTFEASTTGARHLQSGTSVPIFLLVNSYPDWLHRQIVHPHDWGSCARVEKLPCYTSRVAFLYLKNGFKRMGKSLNLFMPPLITLYCPRVPNFSLEQVPHCPEAMYWGVPRLEGLS